MIADTPDRKRKRKSGKRRPNSTNASGSTTEQAVVDDGDVVMSSDPAIQSVVSTSAAPTERLASKGAVVEKSHLTTTTFATVEDLITPSSLKALNEVFRFETMTKVQEATIGPISSGCDVLGRAHTGTGKTLAFLLPAIASAVAYRGPKHLHCLVLAPTRELASQIYDEARQLLTFHRGITVALLIGGTSLVKDKRALAANPTVIVGCPGRVEDHIANTPHFADSLRSTSVVVLDECDQMLDMGFRPAIERILDCLPAKQHRQALLFSATMPPDLLDIAKKTLREGYQFVDTVGTDARSATHKHLEQFVVVLPFIDVIRGLFSYLAEETAKPQHKAIVFAGTARVAGYLADLWRAAAAYDKDAFAAATNGTECYEIHSRVNQGARTKASSGFRGLPNAVLFTSDVSARGVDYPDVTAVFQLGLVVKELYVHRIGRTARAGREGRGILILSDFESDFCLKSLKGLPITQLPSPVLPAPLCSPRGGVLWCIDKALHETMQKRALRDSAEKAYQAWLGCYNSEMRKLHWSPEILIAQAAQFSRLCGLTETPGLEAKTIGKMGLKAYKHLLTVKPFEPREGGRGGGGRGGGGRGQPPPQPGHTMDRRPSGQDGGRPHTTNSTSQQPSAHSQGAGALGGGRGRRARRGGGGGGGRGN